MRVRQLWSCRIFCMFAGGRLGESVCGGERKKENAQKTLSFFGVPAEMKRWGSWRKRRKTSEKSIFSRKINFEYFVFILNVY